MSAEFIEFLLWFPAIVVALTLHEFAHAVVADALGDPTPRALGRVTLNPLSHLDAVGTILLVLVHFGWGRPVPVDTRFLRNPRRDLVLIAAAGPAINLATAVVVGLCLRPCTDASGDVDGNFPVSLHAGAGASEPAPRILQS
ncbi:MAG: site-2 protease family protein, partial [Candidatus Latescibacteria bacterium]|nr:site-2 protease family protein [Candidatus Latescibacterota bacterium]